MDVTRRNFREILPDLDEAINKASFLSVDCEFTGLSTENNVSPYDTPEEAFKKVCENSAGYILIQLGLTIVRPSDEDEKKFLFRSYNFYIFPRNWKTSFKCQGASMSFLAENRFDFGKLFSEGISYCNEEEEKQVRARLEKQRQREKEKIENPCYTPVPEEEKEVIEKIRSRVDSSSICSGTEVSLFILPPSCEIKEILQMKLSDENSHFDNTIKEFLQSEDTERVIGNCNGFQRKLIYEMIDREFADQITATTKTLENSVKAILVERKKTVDMKQLEEERLRNELIELEDNIGMSTVLQKIANSKKMIVGHNMLLDIVFILRQFFHPIPENFKDFKHFAHSKFPYIIDTKFMCSQPKFKAFVKSNILGNLVQAMSEEPFNIPLIDFESPDYAYSLEDKKAHEAGYDSYLTAIAFLGMTNYLQIAPKDTSGHSTALKQFLNRIFLMRLQDVCHINLAGIEPSPSRNHVFHISIPETWTQPDIINHFKNYGPISINWINSTSAFVSLHNRENSSIVVKSIGAYPGVKVQSFTDFKTSLEKKLANQNDDTKSRRKRTFSVKSTSSDECLPALKKQRGSVSTTKADKSKKIHFDECDDWS